MTAGFTLLSRVLGLARDAATAGVFGAGPVLDAFTVAFRLPNLARRLLGEGALSAALLPALVTLKNERGEAAADALTAAVARRLAVGLGAAGVAAAAVLVPLSLGVGGLSADWRLLCGLTAMCAPLAACTCVAAQLAAALHARGRFAAAAACPMLLNLAWLAGVAAAAWSLTDGAGKGDAIYWVAGAVGAAGFGQVAFLYVVLRRAGFRPGAFSPAARAALAGVRAAVLPALLGLSVAQFNSLLDGLLAWGLAAPAGDPGAELPLSGWAGGVGYPLRAGAASRLYFAQRLYQFPVGVLGVAAGTVLYPRFAAAARGELAATALGGVRLVFFLGVPASVGLVLTADLLAAVLLGRGAFGGADAAATAAAAACLGAGAWAACGLSVLTRAFLAAGDRLAPVRAGAWAVAANVGLNLLLVWPLGVAGLAASATAATCGQFVGLALLFGRAAPGWRPAAVGGSFGRACLGGLATAAGCLAARRCAGPAGWDLPAAAELAAGVLGGAGAFLAAARVLGMREVFALVGGRGRGD